MGFDSQANQGAGASSSGEGSDAVPGYWPPPNQSPPTGPGPAAAPTFVQPGYNPPPYSSSGPPAPPPPPYGGYSPTPPGYPPPPTGPTGYGGYGGYGGYPTYGYQGAIAQRTDGTAIAALILAIASFVFCPVVLSIISLALIPGSRRTINQSGGTIGGLGVLTAAKFVAWINIGLVLLLVGIGVIAAITNSSSSSNTLGQLRF